jgi:hypothetical protein
MAHDPNRFSSKCVSGSTFLHQYTSTPGSRDTASTSTPGSRDTASTSTLGSRTLGRGRRDIHLHQRSALATLPLHQHLALATPPLHQRLALVTLHLRQHLAVATPTQLGISSTSTTNLVFFPRCEGSRLHKLILLRRNFRQAKVALLRARPRLGEGHLFDAFS